MTTGELPANMLRVDATCDEATSRPVITVDVLGPVTMTVDGAIIPLAALEQALIARLALEGGRGVTVSKLVAELWSHDNRDPKERLHAAISRTRKSIGLRPSPLAYASDLYRLDVDPEDVDALRFKALVARANETKAVDADAAVNCLRQALALFRGAPLAGLDGIPFAESRANSIVLEQVAAIEERIDGELALGRHAGVLAELEVLVGEHPLRERLWGQLMVAHYRMGAHGDALRTFQRLRSVLGEELATEPSPALVALESAILLQRDELPLGEVSWQQLPSQETVGTRVHDVSELDDDRRPADDGGHLEPEAPIARARDRHALPAQLSSFVGRFSELDAIRRALGASRLVTLTGTGGCGKTRLAVETPNSLGEVGEVWFAELAPLVDQASFESTIAATFGVRVGASVVQAVADDVGEDVGLLILDNCEHLLDICATFADQLLRSCPHLRLLATSREPLRLDGERVYRVPSLSFPAASGLEVSPQEAVAYDAVRLFCDRARDHVSAWDLDEGNVACVVSICRRLDGIPLAVELAAARLSSLSPADIDVRLSDRFRLLTGGTRAALPRQQTLRALIDWSYQMLNDRDKRVLKRLSVLSGGFELAAAEAVCRLSVEDAYDFLDAIESLVGKSLVQLDSVGDSARYSLMETVRQYSAEKLLEDPDGELSAREAHAQFFFDLAQQAAPELEGAGQWEWIRRLDRDCNNIRESVGYLASRRDGGESVLQMAVALRYFWLETARHFEGLEILDCALANAQGCDPIVVANGLRVAANLAETVCAADRTLSYIRRGLEISEREQAPLLSCQLTEAWAWLDCYQGDYESAEQRISEAVALADSIGDRRMKAITASGRGAIRSFQGHSGARQDFLVAADCSRDVGDHALTATIVGNLGVLELTEGNLVAADNCFEEALTLADSTSSTAVWTRLNMAQLAIMKHEPAHALAVTKELADRNIRKPTRDIAYLFRATALGLSGLGHSRAAVALHGVAEAMMKSIGLEWEQLDIDMFDLDKTSLIAELGERSFSLDFDSGRCMPLAEALDLLRLERAVAQPDG